MNPILEKADLPDVDRRKWRGRLPAEPSVLLAILAFIGLIWIFAGLSEEVFDKETQSFDTTVIKALRVAGDLGTPIGPGWVESAFHDITSLGSPTIITLVTVIVTSYLVAAGRWRLGALTAVSITLGSIVEKLLKALFDRARPDIVPHLVDVHSLSFPSGHAMLSAMTYLTIGVLLAQAQTRWRLRSFIFATSIILTLLIGMSRVYLGVHWPTDVLAGWTAGALWALLFWFIARTVR